MKTQITKPNIEENQKESLSEEGRGEKFSEKSRTSGLTWSMSLVRTSTTEQRDREAESGSLT